MATNGGQIPPEQVNKIPGFLRPHGAEEEQQVAAQEMRETAATILAQTDAHIRRITRLGEYARDHGQYIAGKCAEYAQMMRTNADNFAAELLASESRRYAEIEKIIGKGK